MNAQHFKEILESICISTGSTKGQVAEHLSMCQQTVCNWQLKGVPAAKVPFVISKMKEYLFERLT